MIKYDVFASNEGWPKKPSLIYGANGLTDKTLMQFKVDDNPIYVSEDESFWLYAGKDNEDDTVLLLMGAEFELVWPYTTSESEEQIADWGEDVHAALIKNKIIGDEYIKQIKQ